MHTLTTTRSRLRRIVLAGAVLAVALPATMALAAWETNSGPGRVAGSGALAKQTRQLGPFNGVALGMPGKLEIRIGNTESVTIETEANLMAQVETVIDNGTLQIRPIRRNLNLDTRNMTIVVQARQIERLSLGGSGSIDADTLRAPNMQFDLGGSGSINVGRVEAKALSVSLGGSGNLRTGAGAVDTLSVAIGGSGDVQLGQLRSGDASVTVAGSGEATVWARDALSVTIAGSGDVNYYGDPRVSRTVIGSGEVRRMGGTPK